MVVSFDDAQKRALLSLRQTEILMKLQSVTLDPELEKYKPTEWYVLPIQDVRDTRLKEQCLDPNLSSRVRTIHARIYARLPIHRLRERFSQSRSGYAVPTSNHPITPQAE